MPLTIDTAEFTRRSDVAEGERPVAALPRLSSLLLDGSGTVTWRLAGRIRETADGRRQPLLALSLGAEVTMGCVRCLEPVTVAFSVQRDFRLVTSESQAAREDPQDGDFDLLVGSPQFDLAELIEDEAIMALPFAPRHDDCRPPAVVGEPPPPLQDDRPNPFAKLRRLRPDGGGGEA
jgi:uncharacterized protein